MIEHIEADDGYQPGVCNIGPAEIRRRRRIGYAGLVAALVAGAILLALGVPAIVWILLAIPVAIGFEGLIQAHLRFCAGYGMAGLRNLGQVGQAEPVEGVAARAADRRRALLIHATSLIGGLAVAILLVFLRA